MDNMNKLPKDKYDIKDPDFYSSVKAAIEKDLSNLKKIVDNFTQMRVEVAYLESDLMTIIDASTWQNISQLIGLTSMSLVDVDMKKEND